MLIIVIVDDVVLVLADDIHCGKNIERVIHPALNILEVDLLSNLQLKNVRGKHLWLSNILRIGCQKVENLRHRIFCTSQGSRLQFECQ